MASTELHGELNKGFQPDSDANTNNLAQIEEPSEVPTDEAGVKGRDTWGNGLEFLMSCIAMSVGLGNIWRFPYSAYSNGGGAFLIPYIIVLFLVGKPVYFLEMVLGQFSSKGSVKVYDISPAMRGVGTGQIIAVTCVMTYYASLMAIIIYYMFGSFSAVLPWSVCDPEWKEFENCYSSGNSSESAINKTSSSEIYFKEVVLRQVDNIDDGIGTPEWKLTLCLLMAWLSVFLVLLRGVKSSGKAAYFLALFPYVIMLVLLIKAVTLPGAGEGILYFYYPQFEKLLDPNVWYAAVTQCFFSLSVCFGNVVMYASYNNFRHRIYRDAMIVTTLDTFTSLMAGTTIFGILGNLAYQTGKDIDQVVEGGTALAFVSYPDAISKFENVPQLFSFLFFFMLYVLGIGSNVAMASSIITVIRDRFPDLKRWWVVIGVAIFGFCVGLVYITPGGQWILDLVDHHGASFIVYLLGISELITVFYIYGVRKICDDIKFMLNLDVGIYWRLCWAVVTPLFLIVIFIYSLIALEPLEFNGIPYPVGAVVSGWVLTSIGLLQLPLFMFLAIYKRREIVGFVNRVKAAFRPLEEWGPVDPATKRDWLAFKEQKKKEREARTYNMSKWKKFLYDIFGY